MDIWERLSASKSPLLIYGTGDGADKLFDALSLYGIKADAVFASDGFVRDRVFRGYRVLPYSEAVSAFGEGSVICVAFASALPGVMAYIDSLASKHPLCIPDLPVVFDGALKDSLWCDKFYSAHKAELEAARELFDDVDSLALFDDIVAYKLSGEPKYLSRTTDKTEIWKSAGAKDCKVLCDLGAYTGDTARLAAEICPSLETVIAAEPDPSSYKRLCKCELPGIELEIHNIAAWDCEAELTFTRSRGRGSRVGGTGKNVLIRAATPDSVIAGRNVSVIKYDVEGAEARALVGSADTIRRCSPSLIVSTYHRSEDIFILPPLIKRLAPDYRLYLRRSKCYPAWETDIIAIK